MKRIFVAVVLIAALAGCGGGRHLSGQWEKTPDPGREAFYADLDECLALSAKSGADYRECLLARGWTQKS